MLDSRDLLETVTRQRVTATTQSPRGKVLPAETSTVSIRCLVQPHRGNLQYQVEGTVQDVTEALYCNLPADIAYLDTIIRANGQKRRVAFVADEGGQGDHLKVFLIAVNTGSGTTGD